MKSVWGVFSFIFNTRFRTFQDVLHMYVFSLTHRHSIRITWYWRKETSTSTLSLPEKHTPTHTSQTWIPTTTIKGITCDQCCLDGYPSICITITITHHLMLTVVDLSFCFFFAFLWSFMRCEKPSMWDHVTDLCQPTRIQYCETRIHTNWAS